MQKEEKERVVADLTARLKSADTLFVADYRGLTMPQIDALRGRLIEHGAKFTVVKNTLTRRAAEAAGVDALLALLEGPVAIAFIESDGDMVAVAKALADSARETKVLEIRGGLMHGSTISGSDIEELAKLPPFDVLRGQVLGAIIAPLTSLLALVNAPLQNLVGLIDARVEMLAVQGEGEPAAQSDAPERLENAGGTATAEVSETGVEEPVEADAAEDAADQPEALSDTGAEDQTETTSSQSVEDGLAEQDPMETTTSQSVEDGLAEEVRDGGS